MDGLNSFILKDNLGCDVHCCVLVAQWSHILWVSWTVLALVAGVREWS